LSPFSAPAGVETFFMVKVRNPAQQNIYVWDFGDGSSAVTTSVPYTRHAYQNISTYNISISLVVEITLLLEVF
jgi:hypothetical protein